MNISINWKFFLFWSLLITMLVSFSLALALESQFVDEVTITSGVLTGIALFFTCIFLLLETIQDICNP